MDLKSLASGGADNTALSAEAQESLNALSAGNTLEEQEQYAGGRDDLGENETAIQTREEAFEPFECYRHKRIARFSVGGFEFRDHNLFVRSEEENDRFLKLYEGLEPIDRASIVKYNWRAAASVESSVNRGVRGATSTSNIKDPKAIR